MARVTRLTIKFLLGVRVGLYVAIVSLWLSHDERCLAVLKVLMKVPPPVRHMLGIE